MIQPGFLLGINPGLRPVFSQNFYSDPFGTPLGIHRSSFWDSSRDSFQDFSRNSHRIASQTSPGNLPRINSKFLPGLLLGYLSGFIRNSSSDSFQCSLGISPRIHPEFIRNSTWDSPCVPAGIHHGIPPEVHPSLPYLD